VKESEGLLCGKAPDAEDPFIRDDSPDRVLLLDVSEASSLAIGATTHSGRIQSGK